MAHQDYSQICPIFKEGVENELVFKNIPLSVSLDVGAVALHKFGREVVINEIGAMLMLSTGASASLSAIFTFLKSSVSQYDSVSVMTWIASLSTPLVSISAKSGDAKLGAVWISCQNIAGETTASFTSTDWLCISMAGGKNDTYVGPALVGHTIYVRYKDK